MRLHRLGDVRPRIRRARVAGVGLAVLGAVGLGLAVAPACLGGGGSGENAVHVQGGVTAWVNQIDPSLPSY